MSIRTDQDAVRCSFGASGIKPTLGSPDGLALARHNLSSEAVSGFEPGMGPKWTSRELEAAVLGAQATDEGADHVPRQGGSPTRIVAHSIAIDHSKSQALKSSWFDQAFQFIQEFTGIFTPGIVVIFLFAMFWSRANAAGAYVSAVGSAVLSLAFKHFDPGMPFMNRVAVVFLLTAAFGAVTSLLTPAPAREIRLKVRGIDFSTSLAFNLVAGAVTVILGVVYARFW